MSRYISIVLNTLILGLLIVSTTASASSAKLADAIKVYYSGLPDQAITMIKPLAQSGDSKAQLLLGNILHSLSRPESSDPHEDPVTWYQMAATQGSAKANYLLGVIYHNRWAEAQVQGSKAIAIAYYEKAAKLGNKAAQGPLVQLKYRDENVSQKKALKNKAKPKPETVEAPKLKTQQPIATAKVETPEETEVLVTKTEPEPVATIEVVEEPLPTETVIEPSAEEKQILQIAQASTNDISADEVLNQVDIQELATECRNYTPAGFGYYAESINGAHLTGSATISSIERATTSDGNLTINLLKKQSGVELKLSLKEVPKAIAKRFKASAVIYISGIVRHAIKSQQNCEVDLTFKPIKLEG